MTNSPIDIWTNDMYKWPQILHTLPRIHRDYFLTFVPCLALPVALTNRIQSRSHGAGSSRRLRRHQSSSSPALVNLSTFGTEAIYKFFQTQLLAGERCGVVSSLSLQVTSCRPLDMCRKAQQTTQSLASLQMSTPSSE